MFKHIGSLAIAAAAVGLLATPVTAARQSGEERLAKMLEGRVAGEPRRCLPALRSQSLTVLDKTAIVYKQGGKVWVNRTARPQDIDEDDILIIRKYGNSNLCRTDLITTADRTSGMFTGAIFLEDFVPYEAAS